jgi:hypothetical protein
MIPAAVAANPPGRVIAAWWHQLDAHAPRRLWYADLIVRRLDVVVRQSHRTSLDALHRLLLEAIASSTSSTAAQLPKRLGLNDNLFRLIVGDLVAQGLVQVNKSGAWTATVAGQQAFAQGEFSAPVYERQSFHLLADNHAFLPIRGEGTPVVLTGNVRAALDSLRAAVAQPLDWKRRRGFPEEAAEILDLDSPAISAIPAWKRVPFERGERRLLALIQTSDDRVLGFAVRLDGTVIGKSPVLELDDPTAAEILKLSEPDADAWRASWRNWCQTIRGIGAAEIDACAIERFNHVLRVKLPAELRERIKAERPEAFKAEAWLLAGESRCRAACLLDLT